MRAHPQWLIGESDTAEWLHCWWQASVKEGQASCLWSCCRGDSRAQSNRLARTLWSLRGKPKRILKLASLFHIKQTTGIVWAFFCQRLFVWLDARWKNLHFKTLRLASLLVWEHNDSSEPNNHSLQGHDRYMARWSGNCGYTRNDNMNLFVIHCWTWHPCGTFEYEISIKTKHMMNVARDH